MYIYIFFQVRLFTIFTVVGWELLVIFFVNPGSKVAWSGVRTPDPPINPSLIPWQSATATPFLLSVLFVVKKKLQCIYIFFSSSPCEFFYSLKAHCCWLGINCYFFFGNQGSKVAWSGVRTPDPPIPSLIPWQSATATPFLLSVLFVVKKSFNVYVFFFKCALRVFLLIKGTLSLAGNYLLFFLATWGQRLPGPRTLRFPA